MRTWSQSAISVFTFAMRLTLSLRALTAWPGWRLACRGNEGSACYERREVSRAVGEAHQHGRVFCPREVVHGERRKRDGGRERLGGTTTCTPSRRSECTCECGKGDSEGGGVPRLLLLEVKSCGEKE